MNMPAAPDLDNAMRTLARALAPYLMDELRGQSAPASAGALNPDYDDETAARYVEGLGRDVVERAIEFFSALAKHPNRIDSLSLTDRVGAVSPRDLPGILTTPLKRRAEVLGLPRPWEEGEARGRTLWRDRAGIASRVLVALEASSLAYRGEDLLPSEIASHPEAQRPVPSAVFVWSPESLKRLGPGARGSSCLRDSRPGSRAVLYRAQDDPSIVALFDVEGYPKPDPNWRWSVDGRFHLIDPPITRDELLAHEDLRPVFAHIIGRRRLPPGAQQALRPLLEQRFADRQLPLFHAIDAKDRRRQDQT